MFISKVSLVNFRNFANANFIFEKGINTIIGENGSGKTNLFRAIRLLLEDSSYQFAYKLDESDFNRSLADWRGHWIIISIEFSDLSSDESIQSLFIHGTGEITDSDTVAKATYNLFFRPTNHIREKLAGLIPGDKEGLNEILGKISLKEDYETVFTGKSNVNFIDPEVYKELVGDFDGVVFKSSIDTSKFGVKIPHQLSISKEVSFTFIKALRDVVSEFYNNRTNPLLSLLKYKSGDISQVEFEPISNQVKELNTNIESLKEIQDIRKDIKSTIKETVGETYAPSTLSIKSGLSDEASKLLQSLSLFIGEPNEDYEGGIHELSLGGANLVYLTLKLLEYKYHKVNSPVANFLLIEEPEAHIHTHIQKTLFDKIDFEDTQIIYSTHSPQISEVSKISRMNILSKKQNYAEVFRPSMGLEPDTVVRIERYLDAIRSNLLFAKGVILVEGDAEEILIPTMVKKVFGVSLDELGISLINIRSTGFENISQLFHKDRIRNRCSIVTDLDSPFFDISPSEEDTEDEKVMKISLAKASKLGENRKKTLDENYINNDLTRPFYAKHTFEVDFVSNNNDWEVLQILPSVYKKATTIEDATSDLESGDIIRQGKRILTIANQLGKGWLATLLGEHIRFNTYIPKYIIHAIAFACQIVSPDMLRNMINHRIREKNKFLRELDLPNLSEVSEKNLGKNIEYDELIEHLNEIIPDDQIIDFIKALKS